MKVRPPEKKLLGYLAAVDPQIAEWLLALREMVLTEAPDPKEFYAHGYAVAVAFTRTGKMKDAFCHIAAYTGHVNLGFNRGTTHPDPNQALVGTGKSIRHIRIASEKDLRLPYLSRYIRLALEQVS